MLKWSTTAVTALALCAVGMPSGKAFAWGASGHRMIGELAMQSLPLDIAPFLKGAEAARQVGEVAREPDRSKAAGQPHDSDADPAHYVNVGDDLKIGARGPLLSQLPPNRESYDAALRAAGTDEYRAGYLPYAIIDGWQQLAIDFAYWRADVAGAKYAKSPAERTWFLKDQYLREGLTTRDLGYLAHYVGDGSQPMHVSVHSDGWGNYPNPQGFAVEKGLHARLEGAFVRTWIAAKNVFAQMAAYRNCGCTIQQRVIEYLSATQKEVVALYALENAAGFGGAYDSGKLFVTTRVAAGASELRDMIVDAWRASADMTVGYPPIAVRDIESGTANALGSLQGLD